MTAIQTKLAVPLSWCRVQFIRKVIGRQYCAKQCEKSPRMNEIKIQMLSPALYKQIFVDKVEQKQSAADIDNEISFEEGERKYLFEKVKSHLVEHGLWDKEKTILDDTEFKLPNLHGQNIAEHFENLAKSQVRDYVKLANLLHKSKIPKQPEKWAFSAVWTKYSVKGEPTPVPFPEEKVLVFDIETLVQEGSYPTMATAVSDKHWYSWCCDRLMEDQFHWDKDVELEDLIPLETMRGSATTPSGKWDKALVIGHNVGFDRSFVKEQYFTEKSELRFLDTMSLHIAVCGLTTFQRVLYQATGTNSKRKEVREWQQKYQHYNTIQTDDWKGMSTLNNLSDVHKLHCGGSGLDKTSRGVFVEGCMEDVRERFQELMKYCAGDVVATLDVFRVLWTEYNDRFPSAVTLSGMLEMGTGYLPINHNWPRYIKQSNKTFDDMQRESKLMLMKLANEACEYFHDDRFKSDPWLWDLDWSCKEMKLKKETKKKAVPTDEEESEEDRLSQILELEKRHHKNLSHMVGYPAWYRALCDKPTAPDWQPGPHLISYQMRLSPKLLRLTWDGYPLHYDDTHGWGYLVPGRTDNLEVKLDGEDGESERKISYPTKSLHKLLGKTFTEITMTVSQYEASINGKFEAENDMELEEKSRHWEETGKEFKRRQAHFPSLTECEHIGDGPYNSVKISGCWFFKIPHKDGKGKKVGIPLSKDYLNRIEDGTLGAYSGEMATRVLRLSKACSYWKNNQKRIESQMKVWFQKGELSHHVTSNQAYNDFDHYGSIVPRIVMSGTITRRAVEPTWLTASNAYEDRAGSELKSMVQTPPGYHFVGADVDSQELWIAALIGDSYFAGTHGCTALGWMTLQGKKSSKTDLHSKVADTVGISRDHAKVFNYGRIYGAGQRFAERLLMQFNHRLTPTQAKEKAALMYSTTKGKRNRNTKKWTGGSESAMFNKLEEIATAAEPRTPVLGCRISKALEPENVNNDFMTSRVNWVVQSSAVDYLHLMLVCMKWLLEEFDIQGRFSISIHDEVRYLVKSEDRYRAALALQITNLLTRSMFAYKLGMNDLPQSVAFFSAVDIDTCMRKEVNLECTTPSNVEGMTRGYNIPPGEALDINMILEKTGGTLQKAETESNVLEDSRTTNVKDQN